MNYVPTHRRNRQVTKLSDYLRISEAAEYLGVSPNTLRNWERRGKIEAHRHPVNSYRLFKKEELDALLNQVQEADEPKPKRPRKAR
jgi:MerR family copper efflux transcriptional regulator